MPRQSRFLVLAVLAACETADRPPEAKVPASVAAYTSGTVSKETAITVQFTDAIVAPQDVNVPLESSPFNVSPSVDGSVVWSDRQTLELRPKKMLEPGQVYVVKLPLDKIMEVTAGDKTLEFGFTVMKQSFDVRKDGLAAAPDGTTKVQRW